MKTQYDNYPICHVSREVRDYLRESDKELKRQQDQEYQYGVFFHAFDVEERVRGDPGDATCDPIYAVGSVSNLSAEKAYFRREAQKALMNAIKGLSVSARRRLLLHFYMGKEKANQKEKLKIPMERVRRFFPASYTTVQMEEEIVKMCEARYRSRGSRDDGTDGDSNSVANQKRLLTQKARELGLGNTKFYVDDGYTGTNFNRPGFQAIRISTFSAAPIMKRTTAAPARRAIISGRMLWSRS